MNKINKNMSRNKMNQNNIINNNKTIIKIL